MTGNPSCKGSLQLGTTALSGDTAGTDANPVSFGGGRPMWPSLFITDITPGVVRGSGKSGDVAPYDGDWQCGGVAYNPDSVFGTWKGCIRTVDKVHNSVTITPKADPTANGSTLGCGHVWPNSGNRSEEHT